MATFHQRTFTISNTGNSNANYNYNNKSVVVKWFEVAPMELTIQTAGSTLPTYGTNASFFGGSVMTAVHAVFDQAVHTGGLTNIFEQSDPNSKMDYLFIRRAYNPSTGQPIWGAVAMQDQTSPYIASPASTDTPWAIGGFNLMVANNYSNGDGLLSGISQNYGSGRLNGIPAYRGGRARTFIGSAGTTIRFGVMSNAFSGSGTSWTIDDNVSDDPYGTVRTNVFDVYKVMKNIGCSLGLLIDGGGSSKIKYKGWNGGPTIEARVGTRDVFCQLALTADASANCDWSGT
jgi:hypothetical protein